jgi:hypothetical protein
MHSPIQGPLGKQRALLALRAQALRWIEDDVVIATIYGQLFSQVGDLPLKA